MDHTAGNKGYEWRLVVLFFLTWGFVFLDRLAVSFLTPKLVELFQINNAQVGMIGTVATGAYATSTILFSAVANRIRHPRKVLVIFTLGAGVCAALCGLVHTYPQLLLARGLAGLFEGPILPLIMVLMSKAASEKSFGLDTGIINLGVVVVAVIAGPVLVTQILKVAPWQVAFLAYAVPILIIALATALLVKEVEIIPTAQGGAPSEKTSVISFMAYRNMRLCILIAIAAMSGYWCIMLYAPLYLTTVNKMSTQTMGFIASTMGLTMVVYAILIPKLSDVFGRKPVLTLFLVLPALGTLLMAVLPGSAVSTAAYVVVGGILGCVMPIYAIIIPSESVPDHLKASSISFVIGVGEILGGAVFPIVGGAIADKLNLPAMMGVATGLLVLGIAGSLFVRETLPKKADPQGS